MNNEIDPEKITKEAIKRAEQLLSENKLEIAEIILKQLLKCDPKNSSALHLLSIVELNLGENTNNINKFIAKKMQFPSQKNYKNHNSIFTSVMIY